jgi:hypothetical protein
MVEFEMLVGAFELGILVHFNVVARKLVDESTVNLHAENFYSVFIVLDK